MKIRSRIALICASAMLLGLCTSCGGNSSSTTAQQSSSSAADSSSADKEQSNADSTESTAPAAETAEKVTETEAPEFEEAVEPQDGDAFLYINDGTFFVGFNGKNDGTNASYLTYAAGCPTIQGNGDYTVSVDAGTKGCQWDIAGGPNDGNYKCSGVAFAAVIVKGGTTLYPGMSIEIKEIRVDGKPVTLTAKNYTSSDDGKEMRANIYNEWVNNFPEDAHTADGAVTGEFGEYSSQIINRDEFKSWSKIEVDFTVSGIEGEGTNGTAAAAETTVAS